MRKNQPSKVPRSKLVLVLALSLIFLPFFANNASAKHDITYAGMAANGIASSLHNLSSTGPILGNDHNAGTTGKGTTEMCVYCHTPHFADRGKGPLWNRNFAGGTVEAYGTTIAKNVDGNANMFSSIACLSCHDGVTTFDNLVNQPGKGTGNLGSITDPSAPQWTFRMNGFIGLESYDHLSSGDCLTCHGPTGLYKQIDYSNISRLIIGEQIEGGTKTDLSNDHPIGVLYRGQGEPNASASLRARTVNISDVDMNIETEDGAPAVALVTGNLWAVKGFISSTATIQDLLRSGTGQGSGSYVQCSSCHDPHYKNQTNPEKWNWMQVRQYGVYPPVPVTTHDAFEVNGLFLRRVGGNSDSGLCRTCHDKG